MSKLKKRHSASSTRWLQEHLRDPYVQKARELSLRSRSWFKLQELQEKDAILNPGMTVVDLGAAPGGWSQCAASHVGSNGRVVACDLLHMDQIPNVQFLQGDFGDEVVVERLLAMIGPGMKVDLVMSDMAPNISGITAVDQASSIHLGELVLDFCSQILSSGGHMIVKLFQGEGFDAYCSQAKREFSQTKIRKPAASRSRSRELYIVARGYKL